MLATSMLIHWRILVTILIKMLNSIKLCRIISASMQRKMLCAIGIFSSIILASPTFAQERRGSSSSRSPVGEGLDTFQKVIDSLKAPTALPVNATSSDIGLQLNVLTEKTRMCNSIWIAGKPDVGLSSWTQEQKQLFIATCEDTKEKSKQLQAWAGQNLDKLRMQEVQIAEEKKQAEKQKFISANSEILVLISKTNRQASVTRKLDRSISIEGKGANTLKVSFFVTGFDTAAYGERFQALAPEVKNEVLNRVSQILSGYGLKANLSFSNLSGRPGSVPHLNPTGNSGISIDDVILLDKSELERVSALIESGTLIQLGLIDSTQMASQAKTTEAKAEEKARAEAGLKAEIFSKIMNSPNEISAIGLSSTGSVFRVCTTQNSNIADHSTLARGFRVSKDFIEAYKSRQVDTFDFVGKDLEEVYQAIQKKQCAVAILANPDITKISKELSSLKVDHHFLPSRDAKDLTLSLALFQGFKSVEQFNLGLKLKAGASAVNRLESFGINSLDSFRSTVKLMDSSGYSTMSDVDTVLNFLNDEAEGKKVGKSAKKVLEARIEAAAREAKLKAAQDERAVKARQAELGNTKEQWIERCQLYKVSRGACAVASNVDKCTEVKMGEYSAGQAFMYCKEDGVPDFNRMGIK